MDTMNKEKFIRDLATAIDEISEDTAVANGLSGELLGGYFEKYRNSTKENIAARAEQFDNCLIRANVLHERLCDVVSSLQELKMNIDNALNHAEMEA